MSKRVSIPTGVRSGKLTALGPSDQFRRGCRLWESRCDCGNHVFLEPYIITGGRGVSCGCARKDRCMADIAGQRFGRLEAVERLPEKRGSGCIKTEHEQPPLHYVDGTFVEMLTRKKLMANNASGHTGVQATADGKWTARIVFKRKRYYLGTYLEYDDAVKARERAEEELFGGFLADYYAKTGVRQKESLPVSSDTGFNDKSRLRHNSSENQYKGKRLARILENEPRL